MKQQSPKVIHYKRTSLLLLQTPFPANQNQLICHVYIQVKQVCFQHGTVQEINKFLSEQISNPYDLEK